MLASLLGCAETQPPAYSYCLVNQVEGPNARTAFLWLAHCDRCGPVIFRSQVKVGDGIYYTPYYENDDAVTRYGYIKRINRDIAQ